MSDSSRYHTASISPALSARIDVLMEELGYSPSYDVFVQEACLEKVCGEERMLRGLREATANDNEKKHGPTLVEKTKMVLRRAGARQPLRS